MPGEAPVGIEPTNRGFAVAQEVRRSTPLRSIAFRRATFLSSPYVSLRVFGRRCAPPVPRLAMAVESVTMRAATFALLICASAAALEGALAGRGIRARFAELQLPPFSPSLAAWVLIGGTYYIICFAILYRLLGAGLPSRSHTAAFILLLLLMVFNAAWGILFFRSKNLRASFLAFVPYGVLALVLVVVLASADATSALLWGPYLAYLGYALWWTHRVWVLNRA